MCHHTWLYNKTKSVLLCILLHASFTPAQDHLLLTADSPLVEMVLLATYLVGAAYSSPSPEGGWAMGVRSQTQTALNDQSFVERWPGGLAGSVALPLVPWSNGRPPSSVPIEESPDLLPVS